MKYGFFALLAAGSAIAHGHHHHRHRRGVPAVSEDCACSTYVTTRVHAVTVGVDQPPSVTQTVVPIIESPKPVCPGSPDCPAVSVPACPGSPDCPDVSAPVCPGSPDCPETGVPTSTPGSGDEDEEECEDEEEEEESSAPVPTVPVTKVVPVCPGSPECPPATVPTPDVITATAPGTYTIPAKTITLTTTATVAVPKVTTLTPGPNTYGGVTTIVETATTVTCPVATEVVEDDVTTSKVILTTYVCPTPGTYHIGATTTSVITQTEVICPEPTEYAPGTYTHPETTVTLTKTSEVYVCPLETAAPSLASSAEVVPTSVPAVASPSVVKPSVPVASSSEVVAPSAASSSAPAPKPTGVTGTTGDHWSIAYSPYDGVNLCKSESTISSDIAAIAAKGFKAVRVYETSCNTLTAVGGACAEHGMKMIVGVDIRATAENGERDISAICSWAKWELVEMIVVGNEDTSHNGAQASWVAGKITEARQRFQEAGYSGIITTSETFGIWDGTDGGNAASVLCDVVDVVGANYQPWFDGNRSGKQAGEFAKELMNNVKKACDKKIYILEAGWPSAGVHPAGSSIAIASPEEQAAAISSMRETIGSFTSFFTYDNDKWKVDAPEYERAFGCSSWFA